MAGVISPDDPRAADVRALLAAHLVFANEHSPPEDVHALDIDGLETGTMDAFAPARVLYAAAGFVQCQPFADYWSSPNSICMTMLLDASRG